MALLEVSMMVVVPMLVLALWPEVAVTTHRCPLLVGARGRVGAGE
jgi:hypothetical protein